MGHVIDGGDSLPPIAALIAVPITIAILAVVFAVKCTDWFPALRPRLQSWSKRTCSLCPVLRKKRLSDSAEDGILPERPIELENRSQRES